MQGSLRVQAWLLREIVGSRFREFRGLLILAAGA